MPSIILPMGGGGGGGSIQIAITVYLATVTVQCHVTVLSDSSCVIANSMKLFIIN